jgi:hypothetical protein
MQKWRVEGERADSLAYGKLAPITTFHPLSISKTAAETADDLFSGGGHRYSGLAVHRYGAKT